VSDLGTLIRTQNCKSRNKTKLKTEEAQIENNNINILLYERHIISCIDCNTASNPVFLSKIWTSLRNLQKEKCVEPE
jgi:hypothetical protein